MYKKYRDYLSVLEDTCKYRELQPKISKGYIDFSTNDYLGLSRNESVIEATISASKAYGVGATGSRLLSGNIEFYESFERAIARDKKSEAALIFNSGFQANFSCLAALLDRKVLGEKPIVFFDILNHSSLYQAVFLSNPELVRYGTIDRLERELDQYKNNPRPKFIVTETVFGMDGNIVDLGRIIELAERYNAFLYLDEAHATGVFGKNGYGVSTDFQMNHISHLVMGTFSKAIGVSGGYVASSKLIIDYLINKASGFIYSTAPSPIVVAAAYKAWELLRNFDFERAKLRSLGNQLRELLKCNGFDIGMSQSHIIPIILGDEKKCLDMKNNLLEEKIIVSSIRPPTVPYGTSRLRIALTISHSEDDIDKFVNLLKKFSHV